MRLPNVEEENSLHDVVVDLAIDCGTKIRAAGNFRAYTLHETKVTVEHGLSRRWQQTDHRHKNSVCGKENPARRIHSSVGRHNISLMSGDGTFKPRQRAGALAAWWKTT